MDTVVAGRLTNFLDSRGLGTGPLTWERVGEGQSNITYRLARGDTTLVLRRGPRPPFPPSTHDMMREARIQQLLRPRGVPVPEVLAVCPDDDVLEGRHPVGNLKRFADLLRRSARGQAEHRQRGGPEPFHK